MVKIKIFTAFLLSAILLLSATTAFGAPGPRTNPGHTSVGTTTAEPTTTDTTTPVTTATVESTATNTVTPTTPVGTATTVPTETTTVTPTTSPTVEPTISAPVIITPSVTSEVSPTEKVNPVAEKLADHFGVLLTVIENLHNEGWGFGEIAKAYLLAIQGGTTVDDVIALRTGGMGWGQIDKELGVTEHGKSSNLGQIVSGKATPIGTGTPISGTSSLTGKGGQRGPKSNPSGQQFGKGGDDDDTEAVETETPESTPEARDSNAPGHKTPDAVTSSDNRKGPDKASSSDSGKGSGQGRNSGGSQNSQSGRGRGK